MILPLFFAANMSDIKRLMFDGKPAENLDSAVVVYANCRKSLVAMQGWRNLPSIISTLWRNVTFFNLCPYRQFKSATDYARPMHQSGKMKIGNVKAGSKLSCCPV